MVTSKTVDVESVFTVAILKLYNTGSKLEFTTASLIGKESLATTLCETTLNNILLSFFCHLKTCVFCFPPPKPIPDAVLEILVTINISLSSKESLIS